MLTLLFRRGLIGLKKPDRYLQLRFRVSQGISERFGSERPTEKTLGLELVSIINYTSV